jgi:hypothetical protein
LLDIITVRITLIILLLSFSHSLLSQDTSFTAPPLILKIPPLRIIHPMEPGMELHAEIQPFPNTSFELSGGAIFRTLPTQTIAITNQQGFSLGAAVRFYPFGNGFFLYPGYSYAWYKADCRAQFRDGGFDLWGTNTYYFDDFGVKRASRFLWAGAGYRYLHNSFCAEASFGVAAVFRNVEHTEREDETDEFTTKSGTQALYYRVRKPPDQSVRALFQIQLGYAF